MLLKKKPLQDSLQLFCFFLQLYQKLHKVKDHWNTVAVESDESLVLNYQQNRTKRKLICLYSSNEKKQKKQQIINNTKNAVTTLTIGSMWTMHWQTISDPELWKIIIKKTVAGMSLQLFDVKKKKEKEKEKG